MDLVADSYIEGEFEGWNGEKTYELANGQRWEMVRYQYLYKYIYKPKAKIWRDGGYYLEVEGMPGSVEVRPVH